MILTVSQEELYVIVESLLTSLCQREDVPLFGKEGRGEIF